MREELYQSNLIPPYCPNYRCQFHQRNDEPFFVKNGWTRTDKPPFRNQRFKCRACGEQFSANTFSVDFRKKIPEISESVLHFSMNGMSNNSIARLMKVAERTVRNRLGTLARQGLLFEKVTSPRRLRRMSLMTGSRRLHTRSSLPAT